MSKITHPAEIELGAAEAALIAHYGMRVNLNKVGAYGFEQVVQNTSTGIMFQWAPREGRGWHVVIARLRADAFPKHPIHIRPETVLDRFDLRDIAALRVRQLHGAVKNKVTKKEPWSAADCINVLLQCCDDVLRGDFSVFELVDPTVKARASL